MASPQKENGYIAIATEIMEALCRFRINGEARQVLDFIIRKTYGFNKSEDAISLSQFSLGTGLKKNSVCKALRKLKDLNLITQKGYSLATIYRFNKDFSTWKPLPKRDTSIPKSERGVSQKVKKYNPKRVLQKTVTKDNITKDIGEAPKEINELLDYFKKTINPHINFGNKTERKASADLINTYGLERVKHSLAFLQEKRKTDKYLPLITTPYELWVKWAKIKQHLETNKKKVWKLSQSQQQPVKNIQLAAKSQSES